MEITVEKNPFLEVIAFECIHSKKISQLVYTEWLSDLISLKSVAPVQYSDEIRKSIRDLLRFGGYKPAGRGKPSSEYLQKTVESSSLPKIDPIIDIGNIVSYHSGIPISIVDRSRIETPFQIRIGREGEKYVFNSTGQEIDLKGLLCFCDNTGPCANPVKDSMRSKVTSDTYYTINLLWGAKSLKGQCEKALHWYNELLSRLDDGCEIKLVKITGQS